jgi:RimJ/RimL family protein N-acetyltransferase/GNAT superfamily N-acetyltransferase
MILETNRLILRPWKESDAESLYKYAKNPLIGPAAGWPVHRSIENSREIIRDVLSVDETYAVTLKGDDAAIGSIGLLIGDKSNLNIKSDEAEIGYWIGQPYWGQGLIPEAVREIKWYAFDVLHLSKLWCGYFDGNEKSKRVAEKCGFTFHHTEYNKEWALINATKTQHVTCQSREEWRDASICLITENKKDFLPLLLLGDEQESQIDKYLECGELFALYDGDLKSVCVVTDEGNGTLEIQNLATDLRYQRKGHASRLLEYVADYYVNRYDRIVLGTGDVPGILAFYERRGFAVTHRIANYFTMHYDHPMFEDGVLLKDKVYLEKRLLI